jgi:tetratricopeptide (TPR) repeat protein
VARDKNIPDEHDPTLGPAVTAVHVGGESIMDRLLPHAKKIGLAVLGAAVVVTIFFTWRYFKQRAAERSTTKVVNVLDLAERQVLDLDPTVPQPPLEEEVYKSYAERADSVAAAMGKAGENRGAASLVEARVLLRGGKLDEALAIYRRKASGGGIDALIAREGVGIVLEAKAAAATDPAQKQKLYEEALAAFRAIQPDDAGLRRDYALYHEARMLEELGKPAEAKAALEKALAAVPDTSLEPVIKTRLSALGGA